MLVVSLGVALWADAVAGREREDPVGGLERPRLSHVPGEVLQSVSHRVLARLLRGPRLVVHRLGLFAVAELCAGGHADDAVARAIEKHTAGETHPPAALNVDGVDCRDALSVAGVHLHARSVGIQMQTRDSAPAARAATGGSSTTDLP